MSNIKPLGSNMLLKVCNTEVKKDGIIKPNSHNNVARNVCKVIELGQYLDENDSEAILVGDIVAIPIQPKSLVPVSFEGEDYLIINENEVVAILRRGENYVSNK